MRRSWEGAALLGALGAYGWALPRVRREYAEDGHLSRATAGVVYVAYGLHALGWLGAVRARAWPLTLPAPVAVSVGLPLALSGTGLFAAGWRALPPADDSGLATSGLITGGVYRVGRNPQNVGWALLLTGGAFVRRSGLGLGLAALFWMTFRAYVPVEEAFLERTYDEGYRRYRACTPHFLGWPSRDP